MCKAKYIYSLATGVGPSVGFPVLVCVGSEVGCEVAPGCDVGFPVLDCVGCEVGRADGCEVGLGLVAGFPVLSDIPIIDFPFAVRVGREVVRGSGVGFPVLICVGCKVGRGRRVGRGSVVGS